MYNTELTTYTLTRNDANDCLTLNFIRNNEPPRPIADYDSLESVQALQPGLTWHTVTDDERERDELDPNVIATARRTNDDR